MTGRRVIPRPHPALARLAAGVFLLAGPLLGCAGDQRATPSAPPEQAITPVVRGAEVGLEARLWVVQNGSGALAAALREFSAPASASGEQVEIWKRNGFRVLELPLERLESFRESLTTIGPLHRQWLGLLPEWVEVVKGARLSEEMPVLLDSGPVNLGPGRLRLMTRCWTTPSVGAMPDGSAAGASLRIELMPELAMAQVGEPLERMLGEVAITPRSGVRGLAFDRMILGLAGAGSHAIVIVPEDPSVDWGALAPGRPESNRDARHNGVAFGPQPPAVPTLGELMLTSLALPESAGDARIVVVLIPRAPDRFELLPR